MTLPAETEKAREKNALFLRRLRESLPEKSLCTEAIAKAVADRLEIRHDGDVVKVTIRDDMYDSFIRLPNVQAEMRSITREIWGGGTEFVITSGTALVRKRARKGAEAKGHVDPLFDAQANAGTAPLSGTGVPVGTSPGASAAQGSDAGFDPKPFDREGAQSRTPPVASRGGATAGRKGGVGSPFDEDWRFPAPPSAALPPTDRRLAGTPPPASVNSASDRYRNVGGPSVPAGTSNSHDPLAARRSARAGAAARPASLVEQALSAVTDTSALGRRNETRDARESRAPRDARGPERVPPGSPASGSSVDPEERDAQLGAFESTLPSVPPDPSVDLDFTGGNDASHGHAPNAAAFAAPGASAEETSKPKLSRLAVLGDINKMSTPSPFHVPLSAADDFESRPGESPERALDPSLTFDTFVQGTNNEIASLACKNAARNPGKLSNPVFIYGSTGLGKTHLLHAVGNEIRRNHPDWRVLYVTSDDFLNDFMRAVRHHKTDEMRKKYRNADVLLVDDIQFFEKKDSTQIEFFHTFNQLYTEKKQIVLTSDQYPKSIPNIEERLKSRFLQGLIASIEPPTFEDRASIIEVKAKSFGLRLGREQIEYIAQHVKTNVREITGVLNTLLMNQSIKGEPPTLEAIQQLLRKESRNVTSGVDIFSIQKAVAAHFTIKLSDLMGASRKETFVLPRHVAMYLAREMLGMTTTEIAIAFGRKDHTTVLNAHKRIADLLEQDASTLATVKELRRRLEHGSH